ncbi:MAG TPA: hypothetical protein VFU81_20645 [Thermomicrobiales bacterium]|nr:hypothetical protein [Thermomicrobiales bacterium]
MERQQLAAEFEPVWRRIIASEGAEQPYGQGFERAMRIALGDALAEALIARVAADYLSGAVAAPGQRISTASP